MRSDTRSQVLAQLDILFVDSVRLYHQIIEKVFVGTRLRPHFADNGAAALEKVAAGDFAIVCGALHLPDMSGIELCRRLRETDQGKVTPFILLTASAPAPFLVEAYSAGVTDVFDKQSLGPLVTMLQRLLANRAPIQGSVLVVEDTAAQAQFFTAVLGSIGLSCDIAASAEEALALLNTMEYDLVLMDIVLSGQMSGVTLANQIRRLAGVRGEVPILAATAFDDLSRRIELFHLGVDDYVIKPVIAEELIARARNLIGHFRLLQQMRTARNTAEAQRDEAQRELAYRVSVEGS
jgi:CheY-like chemotaxis protein